MMQKSLSFVGRALALTTVIATVAVGKASAQADSTPARPQGAPEATVDSAGFERARQMVLGGNAVAGRALADSLVQAVPAGTPAFGDALYWRATIAATAADAERDYRRIIIEYALAPHAGDALLALAQLEMSRGDRVSATAHLDRFLLEFPERSDRPRAGLWLGRLLLDQNNVTKACAVLREADASVPADQVELKNQIAYYMPRCAGVDVTSARAVASAAPPTSTGTSSRTAPASDTAHGAPRSASSIDTAAQAQRPVATADSVRGERSPAPLAQTHRGAPAPLRTTDTARGMPPHVAAGAAATTVRQSTAKLSPPTAKTSAPSTATRASKREPAPASAKWTVQIAAYQTPAEAEALAAKMKARDYEAYVARSTRIYRVRIGHFATREEALSLLSSLRQRGTAGFVTTAE